MKYKWDDHPLIRSIGASIAGKNEWCDQNYFLVQMANKNWLAILWPKPLLYMLMDGEIHECSQHARRSRRKERNYHGMLIVNTQIVHAFALDES